MKLLVGLGNPEDKYARNRHNVGFMAVERIGERHACGPWKRKFSALAADGTIGAEKVLLLKPQTFMNESGRSVSEAVRFLKLDPSDVIVFHDELDLTPGKLRIKVGGGNAGHNGLRSISSHLGNDYVRVRIGIGHPGSKDAVVHYVLHDFAKADAAWLEPLLDAMAAAAPHLVKGGDARFQSEVARACNQEPELKPRKAPAGAKPGVSPADPGTAPTPAPDTGQPAGERRPAGNGIPHPAGERAAKRQSALAENLKRWLAGRKPPG